MGLVALCEPLPRRPIIAENAARMLRLHASLLMPRRVDSTSARPSEVSRLPTLTKTKEREEGTFSPRNTDRPRTHARTHTHTGTHAPGPTLARTVSATLIQRQRNDPALLSQQLDSNGLHLVVHIGRSHLRYPAHFRSNDVQVRERTF